MIEFGADLKKPFTVSGGNTHPTVLLLADSQITDE
jgi:hypothetical protein